ncbi:MAG: efflux RND transporter periplasmic adaptor subunit [Thermodesulfobacteriota bacterium]
MNRTRIGLGPLTRKQGVAFLAAVVLAFAVGYALRGGGEGESGGGDEIFPAGSQSREEALYVCPMMDIPPRKAPGRCPVCGMELIKVSGAEGIEGKGAARVRLSEDALRRAEVQLARVQRRPVAAEVRLFGRIEYDPAHVSKINAFMPGIINRVYVRRAGQFVRWGEPLFDIYSSDLLATQQQLVEALKLVPSFFAFQSGGSHVARDVPIQPRAPMEDPGKRSPEVNAALNTIAAARHKLGILGMPKADIDRLMTVGAATGIATVYSPLYGQVIEQNAFEGAFVNTATTVFTVGDPLYVWVRLEAYEADFPWLRRGQEVSFQTDAYPGEMFRAKVVNIDPIFNAKARTFSIGALCTEDQGGRLKSGMLVRGVIHAQLNREGVVIGEGDKGREPPLVIPASAPLITGRRALVYVASAEEEGMFEGREVLLGPKAKDHYVVKEGLEEGEQVVVNGNFKIDSAVQILAKPSMMTMDEGGPVAGHHWPGGSKAVHEDYWQGRTRSRSEGVAPSGQIEDEASALGKAPGRDTIRRRRPGLYGEVTGPGRGQGHQEASPARP